MFVLFLTDVTKDLPVIQRTMQNLDPTHFSRHVFHSLPLLLCKNAYLHFTYHILKNILSNKITILSHFISSFPKALVSV